MKIPRSYFWLGALLILPAMMSRAAVASTVLLRSTAPTIPNVTQVQTYAGMIAAIVSPVRAGEGLTVVVLLDSLNAAELENAGKDLVDLYGSSSGRAMRLALLQNGAISVQGPFASRARLKSTLEKIQLATESAAPISAAAVYDGMATSVGQWGANWSRVLVIGNLPQLEPAVRDYAAAILLRAFCSQHVQVSLLEPDGRTDDWMSFFESVDGTIITGELREYSHPSKDASQSLFQVDWTPPVPSRGFVISHSVVSDSAGQVLLKVSEIGAPDGSPLPTILQFAGAQASVADAAKLLEREMLSEADAQRVREDLRAALEVNPLEPGALLAAAAYNEKQKDFEAAARFRKSLVEVRPLDSSALAGLGHELLLAADYDKADEALKHAVDLQVMTPAIAEDLARVRLARNDDKSAISFLEEALRGDAKRQDLWFLQAHAAERVANTPLAIQSFERGLALGGVHVPECGSLLKLYLDTKQPAQAQELATKSTAALPPDPVVRTEFAGILDDLRQRGDALIAWKRVVEVQPTSERAHARIARLLLESGDARASERAADEGLAVAPKFAGLYVVRADALEVQRRMYEAREGLEQGAAAVADPELFARLATVEDSYGGSAAQAYSRLVEVLGASSPQRLPALERGFIVSVRDGDPKRAEEFAAMLESAGHPEFHHSLSTEQKEAGNTLVAGGLDALAFVAHAKEGVPRERFFVEYCRALIERVCSGPGCKDKEYVEAIDEHFQRVSALEALGKRTGNSVTITLSLKGKGERRDTEKALNLLGVKLRNAEGHIELDRAEKKGQVKKQETTSALAVDELGIQEAFQKGMPYPLEIRDEAAAVYPSEQIWRENFYSGGGGAGGFATALLHLPKMARLYVGLSSLDRRTVTALLSAVNIKTLEEHDADLIYSYAAAFALQGSHAAVPGGLRAEPIWASLAGADPAQPGPFFAALLRHSEGKLLAFFFTLSQLDRPHQAFFTSRASRTSQFYKFFSETEEMRRGASSMIGNSAFMEFLRSIPLDADGHVDFPGSAEVWIVAKGRSTNAGQTAKMLTKVAKAAAPDLEDEILLRLVQTHYKGKLAKQTELANFLAVARIDAHRANPLDEQSALVLAQNYPDLYSSYAYFTDITAIGSEDFARFFAAMQQIQSHPALDANLQLGQIHSLVEWISLLARRRAIGPDDAAKLFRFVSDRFADASGPAAYTAASLDSVRAILPFCEPAQQASTADERIRRCLLGPDMQPRDRRSVEYQRVLELQKIPSLDALLSIYERSRTLTRDGTGSVTALQKAASTFQIIELPKNSKLAAREKEVITRYDPAPVLKIIGQLTAKTAKNKPNPRDVEKLSQELSTELQPQVTLALAGQIYAYFLRPADLLVSEDPLLIRKHHYFGFGSTVQYLEKLPESAFDPSSTGGGSNFVGGFAQFGLASGTAAGAGWKTSGSAGEEAIGAQIAAIRGATWERIDESDQRLVGLRCTLAREWIEESASHPEAFEALSDETMGLLSLSRRADLLSAIETRNWPRAWDAVTLPDLFSLAGKFLTRFPNDPWPSPTLTALRQAAAVNDGSRLNILGAIHYHSFGCNHPHLLPDAPYEEYERHMFPAEIAERVAEFKLFLVYLADGMGVEPSALARVAEPLAAKAFRNAKMMDAHDWRAVTAAFSSIRPVDLQEALRQ
jgi:tetratricopeptide (TPR) repeat protein